MKFFSPFSFNLFFIFFYFFYFFILGGAGAGSEWLRFVRHVFLFCRVRTCL